MAQSTPRFTSTDFSEAALELWTPDHMSCGRGFRCERSEFGSHFAKRVPRDVQFCMCQCWVIRENDHLVGFITLLADRLKVYGKADENNQREAQKILKPEEIRYRRFPAVKIGLLAIDERVKGMGAGKRLIEWAIDYVATQITPQIGVRYLTVDALYDVDTGYDISEFYSRLGFEYAIEDETLPPSNGFRTLFLDLKSYLDRVSLQ
jgi:GNAT superfamily N-acetyltransferase